jgi:acylphosphatase
MERGTYEERRRHERYANSGDIEMHELSELEIAGNRAETVYGKIQNVSDGGVGIVTSVPIEPFALFRCRVSMGNGPPHISTLMRVRWSQKESSRQGTFVSGLEYLL